MPALRTFRANAAPPDLEGQGNSIERDLVTAGQRRGREPPKLSHVVCSTELATDHARLPEQVQRRLRIGAEPIRVRPHADELAGLDSETRLLARLTDDGHEGILPSSINPPIESQRPALGSNALRPNSSRPESSVISTDAEGFGFA